MVNLGRLAAVSVAMALLALATDASAEPATFFGPPVGAAAAGSKVDGKKLAKPASETRFYFRAGFIHVATLDFSQELELADVDGPASLAVDNGPVAGSGTNVDSATILGGTVGYVLPWKNRRISVETVLGTPFTVKFRATGTLRDESLAPDALGISTGVPALGEELGEITAIPPVVTLVYRLDPRGKIRPYFGGGVSVLFAFDAKITNPILTEVSEPDFDVPPAPGLVVQAGVEARLTERVYAALDVKFIALMVARAKVENIQVRAPELPLFDTVEVGRAEVNVWVNPLVIQLGLGLDF